MGEYDAVYARCNCDWPDDPRCKSLPNNETRWLNHLLWLESVRQKSSVLPSRFDPAHWALQMQCSEERVLEMIKAIAREGLIAWTPSNDLVVFGTKQNHEKLAWRDDEPEQTINPFKKATGWGVLRLSGDSSGYPEIPPVIVEHPEKSPTVQYSTVKKSTEEKSTAAPPTPQGGHGGAEPDSPNDSPANPPSTIAEFRTETPRHSQNGSAVASAQHQEAKTPYKPTESGTDTPSSIMEAWNALADMPGVRLERAVAFTAKRKASARERLRDAYFRENWRAALDKIRADKFYQGCGDRGWIAGIDYFLRPDTVAKIMEKSKGVMGPPDGWFAGEFEGFEDGVEAMRRKRAQHAAA